MADASKKTSADERAQLREDALTAQRDRDFEVLVRTAPLEITAEDPMGIERIVTTVPSDYTPAQTDPDPKEVERLSNLQKRLDNQKQERLKQLTESPDGGAKVASDALKAQSSTSTSTSSKSSTSGSSSTSSNS